MQHALRTAAILGVVFAAGSLRAADTDTGSAMGATPTAAMEPAPPTGQDGPGLADLQRKLGLSEDQVSKIQAVRAAHHDALKADRDRLKADVAKLQVLVDAKASDDEILATISELKADREEDRMERSKQMDESAAILTPTQEAKAALMMAAEMEARRKDRPKD